MEAIQILTYACAVLFLGFVIARVVKYVRTPVHLRWELYPVAHEKGRAEYGGSIFEELDWWNKPREVDRLNELKEMFLEIVLLKGVYRHNRKLWLFSFPFHFGLYLLIAWLGLLLVLGILLAAGVGFPPGFGRVVQVVVAVLGYAGLGLCALGTVGLLSRRLADPGIRRYSAPVEYLNLLFILAVATTALVFHLGSDPWFGRVLAYLAALVSLAPAPPAPALFQVEVVLGALLLAYMPLSRMGHFIAKYFLYHDVRWSDEPNPRGSRIEKQVQGVLGYRMSWSASHIQKGKSWAEVGTSAPPEDGPGKGGDEQKNADKGKKEVAA